jgi:FAD/FMN-containing dehydrogenase
MTGTNPDWQALRGAIAGTVLLPTDDGYEQARPPFVAGFADPVPRAVVRCAASEDVREVIGFARCHGITTATRGGGHSFAGYSSTRGIVIDVSPMGTVVVSGGVAEVGAGARLGEVYQALAASGVTVPSGTCPSVGIGGITLGGGHGILGRAYGLTLDDLLGAQVVLADRRVVGCDEHRHPDLFWALRGAGGGNFGVVTSFVFRLRPVSNVTNFRLEWSFEHAAALVAAWQRWAPDAPDELTADLELSAGDERCAAVYGALLGTARDAAEPLDDLVMGVGAEPVSSSCEEMSFLDTVRFHAGGDTPDCTSTTAPGRPFRFTKSEFFDRPLPGEAIGALVGRLTARLGPVQTRSLTCTPWGGAYQRRSPHATAFVHRDQRFLLEHLIVLPPGAAAGQRRAAHAWVRASWATVHPWGSGHVYPNFADPGLPDWGWAYYGDNYPRLCAVKARYDPEEIFHFPQSLPAR